MIIYRRELVYTKMHFNDIFQDFFEKLNDLKEKKYFFPSHVHQFIENRIRK